MGGSEGGPLEELPGTCLKSLTDCVFFPPLHPRLTGREKRVGGFDLMWSDGPVSREEGPSDLSGMANFVTNTHLGMLSQTESEGDRSVGGLRAAWHSSEIM